MALDDYKVVLYRNEPDGWSAEVPAIARCYALMPTKAEALAELEQVFAIIETEYRDRRPVTGRHDRNRACLALGQRSSADRSRVPLLSARRFCFAC